MNLGLVTKAKQKVSIWDVFEQQPILQHQLRVQQFNIIVKQTTQELVYTP